MEHSFSPEQLRRVLGSAEGRQLLALLASGGGERLRQAADAVFSISVSLRQLE